MGSEELQLSTSHHIDASEPDADGGYDYYYEYDLYLFSLGQWTLVVRSYSDEATQASVLSIQGNATESHKGSGKASTGPRCLEFKDLKRPLVQQAKAHLQTLGKTLYWFDPRYSRQPV